MWRQLSRQVSSKKFNSSSQPSCLSASYLSTNLIKDSKLIGSISFLGHVNYTNSQNPGIGFRQVSKFMLSNEIKGRSFKVFGNPSGFLGAMRGYAGVAAEAVVSTSEEDVDEIQEAIEEMERQEKSMKSNVEQPKPVKMVGGIRMGKYHILRRRQVQIETEAWQEAAREYRELLSDMCEQKLAPNLPYMKSLFLGWFEPLRDAILAEQDSYKQGKNRSLYSQYFDQLPADMMAVITMHKLMGLLMIGGGEAGAKVVHAACGIGEAIEQEARIHRFLEKTKRKNSMNKSKEESAEKTVEDENNKLRKKVDNLLKKQKRHKVQEIVQQHDLTKAWGQDAQVRVGSRLIQILMETAYIQPPNDAVENAPPDIRPAFMHTLKTVETPYGIRRYGVIECDPLVRKGMEKSARHMVIPYMPMLVPPLNWSGYDRGAYLFLPSYIMRTHGAKQQRSIIKSAPKIQLEPVFQALNTLGSTKWRINKRVLAVVDRIWASGGRLADLVDRDDAPLPEKPDTEDEKEIMKWKWEVKAAKKGNSEKHSQRCDIELKLSVARKMKNEDGFFYPHNLDFRGRAYPMHPHLNHLGSDLCRGILEFSEGRPLGKSGLRWLKIHLANVYGGGIDKRSYEGRIAFAENHFEDVYDSADRPLEGKRWWLNAEDPFQCLATCISLSEALRSSSPETSISHIPIHQDGSCNGLQHYAALGRDRLGAVAVNLVGGEEPADVYSGIATRVLDIMRQDAAQDPATNSDAIPARLLINQVDRKLVKQTVMTSVYGVTYIGARDQIKKRLMERGHKDNSEIFSAACYAAKTTLTALGEMFEAARSIMNWLGDCAKIVALENKAVQWTTPLGLPVVQPYRKVGRRLVKTSLQVLTLRQETDKVMVKRQKSAFPPNFVHSLDGSHMMMTAIACREAGLNFAGVHDSYWTHACDVDQMNKILRQKFVQLYEAPILEDLLRSFEESFPHVNFPRLPERGDFNLKEVLESPYFFN